MLTAVDAHACAGGRGAAGPVCAFTGVQTESGLDFDLVALLGTSVRAPGDSLIHEAGRACQLTTCPPQPGPEWQPATVDAGSAISELMIKKA